MRQSGLTAIRRAATAAGATVALALSSTASPAFAQAADAHTTWFQAVTTEGCIIIWGRPNERPVEEATRTANLSYQGTGCRPGQLVTGEGSVYYGPYRNSYRGRFVNGVLDGHIEAYVGGNLDPDQSGTWVGGCSPFWTKWGNCQPYRGGAESPDPGPGPLGLRNAQFPSDGGSQPALVSAPSTGGNVWNTCVTLEDPVKSGIQTIYAFRNACSKTITISFCMQATYEAAGDWNLCSQLSYKTYDIRAGARLEFPFTPVTVGDNMSDGRTVDRQEIRASGAACVGSSPSVYVQNKSLVFQHC